MCQTSRVSGFTAVSPAPALLRRASHNSAASERAALGSKLIFATSAFARTPPLCTVVTHTRTRYTAVVLYDRKETSFWPFCI